MMRGYTWRLDQISRWTISTGQKPHGACVTSVSIDQLIGAINIPKIGKVGSKLKFELLTEIPTPHDRWCNLGQESKIYFAERKEQTKV